MEQLKEFVSIHILYCQSTLINSLFSNELLFNDYIYSDEQEVFEWWLVTPWIAQRLQERGQIIIEEFGCYWWGRQTTGQAICLDEVIAQIANS